MEDSAKGWSDFGGKMEMGETPYKAALREGSEELTGFLGNDNDIKRYLIKIIMNNNNFRCYFSIIFFFMIE